MKKIAYMSEIFPNLSETFIIDQMIYVASQGHQVTVYYDHLKTEEVDILNKLTSFNIRFKKRWVGGWLLQKLLKYVPYRFKYLVSRIFDCVSDFQLNTYDTVLAHFGQNGLRLAYSKKYGFFNRPFITFFHGNDIGSVLKDGKLDHYKVLLKSDATLLPVNGYFQKLLIDSGANIHKTHVYHMGIDCDAMPFEPPQFVRPIKFLSVCRLVEKKGIFFAIEALNAIHKTHPEIDWQYNIIGGGPLQDELKQVVKNYGLESKISFLGSMAHDNVQLKMKDADFFILPSVTAKSGDVEGIPVALMEAMGMGLIACSTYHSGIPELIVQKKSGFLSAEKDSTNFAENILWAIQNPDECKTISQEARLTVEQNFNKKTLYQELLNYL